jgi:hypothetical protein
MSSHGSFSENPKTEWLTNLGGEDRDMKLLNTFSFTDPNGKVWIAPIGAVVNGASIPRPLWSTVGSPYTGEYRRASIVHDVACDSKEISRKDADVMFFHACRAGGCDPVQARLLYAGVRIGAWASSNLPNEALSANRLLFRNEITVPFAEESFIKAKLSDIANEMKDLPNEPTIEQLDKAIAKHLKFKH